MKSCVLTFVLVVCVLSGIKSQTIGLKINPIATTTNFSEEYGWGFGSGVFYDLNIYKRLGFSSGIFFTQLRESESGAIFSTDIPPYSSNSFYF